MIELKVVNLEDRWFRIHPHFPIFFNPFKRQIKETITENLTIVYLVYRQQDDAWKLSRISEGDVFTQYKPQDVPKVGGYDIAGELTKLLDRPLSMLGE